MSWFRKKATPAPQLTRWEAFDLLVQINDALSKFEFARLMTLLKMDEALFKDVELEDILNATAVRIGDLMIIAGIEKKEDNK